MELPAHEVLQALQTLLSSQQIAVPASNVATLPKNMNSIGRNSSHLSDGGCQSSVPTPPEGDPAGGTNGPQTPTHSERLEADFRRGMKRFNVIYIYFHNIDNHKNVDLLLTDLV